MKPRPIRNRETESFSEFHRRRDRWIIEQMISEVSDEATQKALTAILMQVLPYPSVGKEAENPPLEEAKR